MPKQKKKNYNNEKDKLLQVYSSSFMFSCCCFFPFIFFTDIYFVGTFERNRLGGHEQPCETFVPPRFHIVCIFASFDHK